MDSKSGDTACATARYIESMLMELRTMSQSCNCDMLTYLLEMAMIEASDIASGKTTVGIRRAKPVSEKISKPNAKELAALFMSGDLK